MLHPLQFEPPPDLVRRYARAGPRYTSYPTAPIWTEAFGPTQFLEHLDRAREAGPDAPFSIYAHVPFCRRLCTYCGCNVVISRQQADGDHYLDRVEKEVALVASRLGDRREVNQLHWGGGTPTFLDENQLRRLFHAFARDFRFRPSAEISVEVNPASTQDWKLGVLRELGFNRLSMGVQDLDPSVQEVINRYQTEEQTRALFAEARRLGFSGINLDLVYGLPLQTHESWVETMKTVVELRPDRVAIFAFAYLPEQIRHQAKLPKDKMLTGPQKLALLRHSLEALLGAGYVPVGMDHFALPDDTLAKAQQGGSLGRNFQGYTVQAAADLLGFGVSAISDVGNAFAQNAKELPEYCAAVDAGRSPVVRGYRLTSDDLRRRTVINQLMCSFVADLGADDYFAAERERLRPFEADGLLSWDGTRVVLTELGRYFVRNVAMEFDAHLTKANVKFSQTV